MNAMNGRTAYCWDVQAVSRLGGSVAEIIHINLEQLCRGVRAGSEGDILDLHGVFHGIPWQVHLGVHKVLC